MKAKKIWFFHSFDDSHTAPTFLGKTEQVTPMTIHLLDYPSSREKPFISAVNSETQNAKDLTFCVMTRHSVYKLAKTFDLVN